MFGSLLLFTVLIGAPRDATCYILYDAAGAPIYQGNEPPFSRALPPSAEAEASRARGEKLMAFTDMDCRHQAGAGPVPRATPPAAQPSVTAAAEDPRMAPVAGRAGGGSFFITPGRPDGDPEQRTAYDPFAKGEIRGGLAAGLERIRNGTAAGNERALSFLDTATLAATEGKEAMHRAAMAIASFGGERAYDSVYNCWLGNDPGNCIMEDPLMNLVNQALNPGTTAFDRERANRALATLNTYGLGKMAEGNAEVRIQSMRIQTAQAEKRAADPTVDQLKAKLLQRAMGGDQEALRLWFTLQPKAPDRTAPQGEPGLGANPPAAAQQAQPQQPLPPPRLTVEEAERMATEEEKQRKNWWLFQLPLDRRRITERTLEILEQSTLEPNPYKTRGEVFDAYRLGRITHEQALRYLQALGNRSEAGG